MSIAAIKTTSSTDSSTAPASTQSIQIPSNAVTSQDALLTLSDTSSYFCPFVFNGTDLIFFNPDKSNRLSTIADPLSSDIPESKDVTDLADYSTDNIALIEEMIPITYIPYL